LAGGPYDSLWQTLVPLLVGFALLVGLVLGLGFLSVGKIREITFGAKDEDRRLAATSNTLLNLRLALSRLDTEARLRGRLEAGTGGVMLPPTDLRLRNARGEVETLLAEFDAVPLAAAKKRDVHERAVSYVNITKDLREYSLSGFTAARDLDDKLRSLMSDVTEERARLDEQRFDTLKEAQAGIRFRMWLAALVGLLVATATILEVWRRFRQMRRGYAELRRERQFSTQMLEGMPSAVAAIDRADRIRSANAAFFSLFPGAAVGASIHDKFTTADGLKLLASATTARHGDGLPRALPAARRRGRARAVLRRLLFAARNRGRGGPTPDARGRDRGGRGRARPAPAGGAGGRRAGGGAGGARD
jgi:hypothetical protein